MSIAKELVDRDWLVTARAQATFADPAQETPGPSHNPREHRLSWVMFA
jgi:hypothetical protein